MSENKHDLKVVDNFDMLVFEQSLDTRLADYNNLPKPDKKIYSVPLDILSKLNADLSNYFGPQNEIDAIIKRVTECQYEQFRHTSDNPVILTGSRARGFYISKDEFDSAISAEKHSMPPMSDHVLEKIFRVANFEARVKKLQSNQMSQLVNIFPLETGLNNIFKHTLASDYDLKARKFTIRMYGNDNKKLYIGGNFLGTVLDFHPAPNI